MNLEYKPRVLVVDDEASVRASLISYLDDRSVTTISAANGRAAIESIIYEKPDVVLLDLDLPGIDGLEVLRRALEHGSDSAIIVMSGKGMMGDVIESLRLGACDYIPKPIHDLELLDYRLEKAVERIQILRESRRNHENLEELVKLRTAQLENANRALEAKNVAFGEVLASGESERRKIGHQVSKNVESVILPTLRSLSDGLNLQQRRIVEQLEQGLQEIVSPFIDNVSGDVAPLDVADLISADLMGRNRSDKPPVDEALSEREREVLRLVAEGMSSKQIAAQLYVTTKTIVWHRQSIMGKLDLRSIAELTKYAVRMGLTTLDH